MLKFRKKLNNIHVMMITILTFYMFVSLNFFRKSVFQKLYDLYIEECEKEPEVKVSIHFYCVVAFEM